ncbi:SusC/RagA family TonB-linked outer membrane protein [Chitinophaga arvensicola]|uniref:TonB-linked outer membrane protein, SusC/RagA family n=1 Tax=Chitinophaga arvensicola TaxID=29529 RepID=A0A1I0RDE8_9BACT|nr:SusC/RagA family TonB-linked outer membrane protein [Chitinophaga arvensicola]SEW38757.1 TonB-linked outer membrane protein, SusC/RagA family [Chitinophaga arvensicola]
MTQKTILLSALLCFSCSALANPRPATFMPPQLSPVREKIQGTVKDKTGDPLLGVSVSIKGTQRGTQSDASGHFSLEADKGQTLVFSFVGYARKEAAIGASGIVNVTLEPDNVMLKDFVVTALGIEKQSKSLTYDIQSVGGKELQTAKDVSFVNSLTGKVAGVVVNRSSSGAGGSTKVVLRGNKSLNGSSNVLYVVDGIPLADNTSGQPNSGWSGQDGGDGISNLNPDDIENVSILKGASASALYGSSAANGVILITTKKGKAGGFSVNLVSNTTFEKPFSLPEFQNNYGQSAPSTSGGLSQESWGEKTPAKNNPADFFNTGKTLINSISVTNGTEKQQLYLSYSNTHSDGIIPLNTLNKHNFTFRSSSNYFNEKVSLDVSANYITQNVKNRPSIGLYFNPLTGVYLFPRSADFNAFKTYEVYDPVRQIMAQNWPYMSDIQQNPYWIQNRNPNVQKLDRIMGAVAGKYNITPWLNLQARFKIDKNNYSSDQRLYATTSSVVAGVHGNYNYNEGSGLQTYADALLNVNKDQGDFTILATLGASLMDNKWQSLGFGGFYGKLLKIDNYFNISNMDRSAMSLFQTTPSRSQTQSVFGSAQVGWQNKLFVEVTGRNDWSSSLAFTPNPSFFYPSAGLSAVLSNIAHMPAWISFAKVRLSVSQVGNSIPAYISTNPAQFSMNDGNLNNYTYKPFVNLKPEKTQSIEGGTEWRFFADALSLDVTWYKTNTKNQFFSVQASRGTGYDGYYINAGNVQNQGLEGTLSFKGPITGQLRWNPTLNFSMNRNKIIELYDYIDEKTGAETKIDRFVLSSFDSYSLEARKGGAFGDIYARGFVRDASGKVTYDADGLPVLQEAGKNDQYEFVGNSNPKFLLGFNNTFTYRDFSLSFLIDGRFGGNLVDMTAAFLDYYGVSAATGKARDNGGVDVNGKKVDPETYYKHIGNRTGALAAYAYSATNVRLRELSFGYTIPGKLFNNKIKNLKVAVLSRNLFFFYKKAPYDPDVALSTGNTLQGIDLFGMPSTRSIGFNVSVSF